MSKTIDYCKCENVDGDRECPFHNPAGIDAKPSPELESYCEDLDPSGCTVMYLTEQIVRRNTEIKRLQNLLAAQREKFTSAFKDFSYTADDFYQDRDTNPEGHGGILYISLPNAAALANFKLMKGLK